MTKLKKSNCDKTLKTQIVTKLKKSNMTVVIVIVVTVAVVTVVIVTYFSKNNFTP